MTTYAPPVKRRKYGRGHGYVDANGQKVPSVTSILKALPKDALINWSANATAEAALNRWDELSGMKPGERLKTLQKARYDDRDTAANRGTEVHRFAERYLAGEEVPIPDDIAGHTESYISWVDDWQPESVFIEATVMSHRHGYAGTCDLAVEFGGAEVVELLAEQMSMPHLRDLDRPVRGIGDVKTSRSGIFPETALQLAAYRHCDVWMDDAEEIPMPAFDFAFALHVRGDGYEFRPMIAGPEQLREFLYVREVLKFDTETGPTYVGDPLRPARGMQRRRLEVLPDNELTAPAPLRSVKRKAAAK